MILETVVRSDDGISFKNRTDCLYYECHMYGCKFYNYEGKEVDTFGGGVEYLIIPSNTALDRYNLLCEEAQCNSFKVPAKGMYKFSPISLTFNYFLLYDSISSLSENMQTVIFEQLRRWFCEINNLL